MLEGHTSQPEEASHWSNLEHFVYQNRVSDYNLMHKIGTRESKLI